MDRIVGVGAEDPNLKRALRERDEARAQVGTLREALAELRDPCEPYTEFLESGEAYRRKWNAALAKADAALTSTTAAAAAHDEQVRAEERERCAKIAEQDSVLSWAGGSTGCAALTAQNIAAEIRAEKGK